jgi:hypothetical protein
MLKQYPNLTKSSVKHTKQSVSSTNFASPKLDEAGLTDLAFEIEIFSDHVSSNIYHNPSPMLSPKEPPKFLKHNPYHTTRSSRIHGSKAI